MEPQPYHDLDDDDNLIIHPALTDTYKKMTNITDQYLFGSFMYIHEGTHLRYFLNIFNQTSETF